MSKNIYLATSWKNKHYDRVLALLRDAGHNVYDFREKGFEFNQLHNGNTDELHYLTQAELLDHPTAVGAFEIDMKGLSDSDVLIMLYPCGNDAHVELGWAVAQGMYTIVYLNEGYKVGLMDKMASKFVHNDSGLLEALR